MEDSFDEVMISVLIINVLAYMIKYIQKKKGCPVSWFSKHLRDLHNLWRLIRKTQKTGERLIYFILGAGFPIRLVVFLYSALSQMKVFVEVDWCEYEEQFGQTPWSGIVTNKCIDQANHAYETLEIENDGQTQRIQNWVLFQNGNFEQKEIGDSIAKRKG